MGGLAKPPQAPPYQGQVGAGELPGCSPLTRGLSPPSCPPFCHWHFFLFFCSLWKLAAVAALEQKSPKLTLELAAVAAWEQKAPKKTGFPVPTPDNIGHSQCYLECAFHWSNRPMKYTPAQTLVCLGGKSPPQSLLDQGVSCSHQLHSMLLGGTGGRGGGEKMAIVLSS